MYLNNLPHWQLCGHTPAETGLLVSQCADNKDLWKNEEDYPTPSPRNDFLSDDYDPASWLTPTMPIIVPKTPGRNDPCPCGSGKKYKNCCGRGN